MMNSPSEEYEESRRSLIQHYIEGKLPDWADTWIEDQIRTDPGFREQVIAQQLVAAYFENRQFEETIQQEFDNLASILKVHKPRPIVKGFPMLYLLGWAAACLCLLFGVGYLINSSPAIHNREVHISDDSYGFSNPINSVPITFYDRKPGFWRPGNEYNWKGDTLQLFGGEVFEKRNKRAFLTQSMYRDYYILNLDNRQYLIHKYQNTRIPMRIYEQNP